jgi:hypothetical protein
MSSNIFAKKFSGNIVMTASSGFLQPALQDRLFDFVLTPASLGLRSHGGPGQAG